jgi:chromosome segregation ATPase
MSVTIESDLKEILARFEAKLDNQRSHLEQKLDNIQSSVTELKVDIATVKTKLDGLEKEVADMKGSQSSQIWTLIGVLSTAFVLLSALR